MRRIHLALLALLSACHGAAPGAGEAVALEVAAARDAGAASRPSVAAVSATAPPCRPEANEPAVVSDDVLHLSPAGFDELPGWSDDHLAEAVPALLASCAKLAALADDAPVGARAYSGTARDWRRACRAAAKVPAGDDAAARAFFEREFAAYAASGKDGPTGKLTGYYVQSLRGSRTRHGRYQFPVLARPPDLVSVELAHFIPDGHGRRIWGRVDAKSGKLVAYPSRKDIRRGALGDGARPLLFVDDAVEEVFAEIEGSGKVALDDGTTAWIGFAGKNGLRFHGVGGILRRLGELGPGEATIDGIRAWFAAHPGRFDEIVDRNPAKVFFQESDRAGAIGTQDVVLTPRRSLAVDRGLIALSTPVWVDTRAPAGAGKAVAPWHQLLIAQDTGGAILGPVRGDIYWGADDDAVAIGGRMGGPGRMWLLLPRALDVSAMR